ncbi:unnamed protein product, partial [Mesorhabditis belari]|uniref:Uncharacterized protein n=1 Tax=Mesorhabditis belari TaxID=2138241 RepID=A0AAF3FDW1_9BILA
MSNWAMANLSHVYPLVSLALNVGTIAKLLYLRWFSMDPKPNDGDTAQRQYKNQRGQAIEFSLLMICLVSLLGQFGLMIYADNKTAILANMATATLIASGGYKWTYCSTIIVCTASW